MTLHRITSAGLALSLLLLGAPLADVRAEAPIVFEDVTQAMGLAEHLENWEMAHGGAWADATGNGFPDLYIGAFASKTVYDAEDAPLPNMLLLHEGDRFVLSDDEAVRIDTRGLPRRERTRVSMALFADLNNNDRLDLLVGMHGSGPDSHLFENRGGEGFRDVTPTGGGWPAGFNMRNATAIDLDQDGLLDLILIDGAYGGDGQRVVALRNLGDFQFEDVSAQYGFPDGQTRGLGTAVGDVNNDGRLDLFVADANRMFISQADGTYHEYNPGFFALSEAYDSGEWACGAAFADLTGNGLLDLIVTVHGQASAATPHPGHFFLYLNRGIDDDGMPRFEDVTAEAGLDVSLPRSGATGVMLKAAQVALVDLNHNGRRDILLGMIRQDEAGRMQPVVFQHTGVNDNGVPQFAVPPIESIVGYYATAPVTDFDRDGRMDIFLATWFDELPSALFRNVTEGGNHLVVRVRGEGEGLNPMGIGATIRLYAAGHAGDDNHLLSRGDIALANGYSVGEEAKAHFGLGDVTTCDVVVTWQGHEVTHTRVQANQYLTITVPGR